MQVIPIRMQVIAFEKKKGEDVVECSHGKGGR